MNDIERKAVNELLKEGQIILQIVMEGTTTWFVIYSFHPGFFNTAESVEFNTAEGIDITEFITKNAALYHNHDEFISHFNKYIDENPVIRCEFSTKAIWYKYQMPFDTKPSQRR